MPAGLRGIARGTSANLIGAAVTGVVNFGLTVAVTHGLSKTAAGVFFSATSLFLLATSIGQLGTDTGLVYFISRCRALGNPERISGYMRTAAVPVFLTALVMGAGLLIFAPQLGQLTNPAHAGQATSYLRILALLVPVAGLESVALAGTSGLGTMRPNALIDLIGRAIVQIVLVLIVLATEPTAALLALAWGLPYLPAAIAAWWSWSRRRQRIAQGPDVRASGSGAEFWRFTAPRSISSVIQIAMQRFDIVLVGGLAGAATAAVYAASTRFIVAGQMGSNAVSRATRPRLGAALARANRTEAQHIYQSATAWLVVVTWPIYLMLLVFSDRLLHVFGHGYSTGRPVLIILSLAMMVATGCGMVDAVLNMGGKTTWNLANVALAFGTNLGLDLWLIPPYGVLGASIGWGVAIFLQNVVPLTQVAFVLHLHPFGRATLTAMAIAVACFAAVPGLVRIGLGSTWTGLFVGLVIGIAAYLALLWRFRGVLALPGLRTLLPRAATTRGSR
ncbi:MAG: lipopolysaccharide biosynthesis protein [Mycobacteriales bacterium]